MTDYHPWALVIECSRHKDLTALLGELLDAATGQNKAWLFNAVIKIIVCTVVHNLSMLESKSCLDFFLQQGPYN